MVVSPAANAVILSKNGRQVVPICRGLLCERHKQPRALRPMPTSHVALSQCISVVRTMRVRSLSRAAVALAIAHRVVRRGSKLAEHMRQRGTVDGGPRREGFKSLCAQVARLLRERLRSHRPQRSLGVRVGVAAECVGRRTRHKIRAMHQAAGDVAYQVLATLLVGNRAKVARGKERRCKVLLVLGLRRGFLRVSP